MSNTPAIKCLQRLQKDYKDMLDDPIPYCVAAPVPENMLRWYFILTGPPGTSYAGGRYVGVMQFPHDFPFAPPTMSFVTPNGRFGVNRNICLSITHYHPESWSPVWTVKMMLAGLLSFMTESAITSGSVEHTVEERVRLASNSLRYNIEHFTEYQELFPAEYQKDMELLKKN
ncbi:putative Ubiquitin conjugating enzyme [Trypanosoma vivax]|uniref:Putative ubiquitin-protein ligase n=1 Tax=Trypanosoma vivax (strain Y486) TaxID=1055687 RepID=G0TUK5_TRYVY|nr:putative Ubiquitin conjugating enzyme [Trypanosoma vivax]KAH8607200.1 putative Ubiquitin conjugating enzyme [Trypanosoma vivax]CCC47639.1 putative ubiquitin-protein ligase [Trypanosoma vivax Y486]